jgi:hypothetical protein
VRGAAAVNVDETGWRLKRSPAHALGCPELPSRDLPDRPRPPRARGGRPARRGLRRCRRVRPLVGLPRLRPRPPPALLVAPDPRLHRPRRGAGRAEGIRRAGPRHRPAPVPRLGAVPAGRRPAAAEALGGAAQARARGVAAARLEGQAPQARPRLLEQPAQALAGAPDLHRDRRRRAHHNRAERALRGPAIHRKLSPGSQSEQGERTIERLLSAPLTRRLQRPSLFSYLTDALGARARGDPVPPLA